MSLDTEHSVSFRVYIEDTDVMGVVYHANYLCFFDRARIEMLRDDGLSLITLAKCGTHFAIHEVNVRYLFPARMDDVITIKSSCKRIGASSLEFQQLMYNQSGNALCEAIIRNVCVNNNFKPKRLPSEYFGGLKSG